MSGSPALTPSDVFAGPIVRRASPELAAIWIATTKPAPLAARFRLAGTARWLGTSSAETIRVFDALYVHLVLLRSAGGQLPAGRILEYTLGTLDASGAFDDEWFLEIVRADELAYPPHSLPTLHLQEPGAPLNVLYASCRKAHDIKGGHADAMRYGDSFVQNNSVVMRLRPHMLCLGGDQIYADDVHPKTFSAVKNLAAALEGSARETLPHGERLRVGGKRKAWLKDKAGFSSGEAEFHLVTFAEYVAMYGLALNERHWLEHAELPLPKEISGYRFALRAVRRLLANTPTYMIFDDHDVTDDWNLHLQWIDKVKHSKIGQRIITNALAAYWLFQAWGNDPPAESSTVQLMRAALEVRLSRPEDLALVISSRAAKNQWEFATPTSPVVYFLDTRTRRGHVNPFRLSGAGAPAFLKDPAAWSDTNERLRKIVAAQGRTVPLVLVATGPVFNFGTIDALQGAVSRVIGPETFDWEGWGANLAHLVLFLILCGDSDVVLLSGDVHFAFTSTATFSVFDSEFLKSVLVRFPRAQKAMSGALGTGAFLYESRFLQLNSSAAKNFASGFLEGVASLTPREQGTVFDSEMNARDGRYAGSKLYVRSSAPDAGPHFVEEEVTAARPSFVLQQRLNDSLNTRYTSSHNIGFVRFSGRKVENSFLIDGRQTSLRTFDFATDSAWTFHRP